MQPGVNDLADLVAAYQKNEFLAGLPVAALEELAVGARVRHFEAGEPLLWEGEPSPGMVYLYSGRVKLFKLSANGRELVILQLGAGQTFNEISALDGGPNPVSAAALEAGRAAFLPPPVLRRVLLQSTENAESLILHLAERMRYLVNLVEELSFLQINNRLARVLCQMFREAEPGKELRVTHKELAARLGTVREVVARGLKAMQAIGAVRNARGKIMLVDAARLQAWCEISGDKSH